MKEVVKLGALAVLVTPITILLHELGHFMVAVLLGLPAQLHPASVSGGAHMGGPASPWMQALQAGGGPAVTVIMSSVGLLMFRRHPDKLLLLAFAAAAVSRLFTSPAYLGMRALMIVLGRPHRARPNFDEHNVAVALGFSPVLSALLASAFLLVVTWALFRQVPSGQRRIYFVTVVLPVAAANLAWPAIAPPVLATAN